MAEKEMKKSPAWKTANMKLNGTAIIKLKGAKPIKTGTTQYGEWNLWVIEVKDQPCHYKDTDELVEHYTGDALFFPTEKTNKRLLELTGSNKIGLEVEIKKVAIELKDGKLGSDFEVTMIKDGGLAPAKVTYQNDKFMGDFKKFVELGFIRAEKDTFVKFGSQEPYKISADNLNALWVNYQETKN